MFLRREEVHLALGLVTRGREEERSNAFIPTWAIWACQGTTSACSLVEEEAPAVDVLLGSISPDCGYSHLLPASLGITKDWVHLINVKLYNSAYL